MPEKFDRSESQTLWFVNLQCIQPDSERETLYPTLPEGAVGRRPTFHYPYTRVKLSSGQEYVVEMTPGNTSLSGEALDGQFKQLVANNLATVELIAAEVVRPDKESVGYLTKDPAILMPDTGDGHIRPLHIVLELSVDLSLTGQMQVAVEIHSNAGEDLHNRVRVRAPYKLGEVGNFYYDVTDPDFREIL